MVVNAIVALPVMGAAPPWPRAPPASSLLAGLRKPPLQGVRHWSPGRMAGQKMGFFEGHAGRDIKGGCVTASASNGRRVSTWKSASAGHSQATAHVGSGPNGDHAGHCGEVIVGVSATRKKGVSGE